MANVERKRAAFIPVVITLETQAEVDAVCALAGGSSINSVGVDMSPLYSGLLAYRQNKFSLNIEKEDN